MCSTTSFMQKMENDHGDLADIVRASGGGGGVGTVLGGGGSCSSNTSSNNNRVPTGWQYPSEPVKFPLGIEEPMDNFGDPFSMLRDPLLQELDLTGSGFFVDRSGNSIGGSRGGGGLAAEMNIKDDHTSTTNISNSSNNIFSRILQISPNSKMLPVSPREMIPSGSGSGSGASSSPRGSTTTPSSSSSILGNDQYMVKASSSTGNCSIDNAGAGIQISLPRNPGIKRRKSQAKKVVCIPAPAAANSRPSGEVVPSDLWAWRKYGQKPIKGSPYPRGYYRCSSSKGCSARKQVERSRTDPNMLVITYTSEHNHPWPTQRNALAGSTRSQPFKTNATSKSALSSQKLTSLKEHKEISNINTDNPSSADGVQAQMTGTCSVKEEMGETEKLIDMSTDGEYSHGFHPNTFQSLLSEDTNNPDDFFADLGELDSSDPLNLLLTQGFTAAKADDGKRENKGLDPFSLFDWTGNNNNNNNINNTTNTNNNSSFEDLSSRRGL